MTNDSISMVKRAVKTWLLTDEFLAIVHDLSQGLGLGAQFGGPAVVYTSERTMPPASFPAAELLGISSSPRTPDSSVQFYDHTVDVLWTVAGSDEDTIVLHAETLVLATRKMSFRRILPMPSGSGAAVVPGPEDYGPLMQSGRTAQPLVKAARIRLVIPTMT